MLTIRRDKEIHREEGGWFSARWHFSFDHYRDPANDSFGAMRVFNDDRLVPGAIWPMHPTGTSRASPTWSRGCSGTRTRSAGRRGPCPPGRCSG
jgi:hypothetical protein